MIPTNAARFDAFHSRGFLGRACTWPVSGMSIHRHHPHRSGQERIPPRLAHPCFDPCCENQRLHPDDDSDSDSRWAITNDDALNHGRHSRQLDTFDNAADTGGPGYPLATISALCRSA